VRIKEEKKKNGRSTPPAGKKNERGVPQREIGQYRKRIGKDQPFIFKKAGRARITATVKTTSNRRA